MPTKSTNQTKYKEEVFDPITNPDKIGHIPMSLHPKEAALILLMRRLNHGVLKMVTVKDGLPCTIEKETMQRITLENPNDLSAIFEKEGEFFPLGRG